MNIKINIQDKISNNLNKIATSIPKLETKPNVISNNRQMIINTFYSKLTFSFILLVTFTTYSQDFAKDTLIVNGTQPATILRLKKTKVFIAQNKLLSTPYIKQKDGSFISNGIPFIQIYIDQKKHTLGSTFDYVDVLFEKLSPGAGGSNEIITIDNVRALLQTKNFKKDKRVQIFVFYPLTDRFINLNFVFKYSDDEDKENKIKGIEDILNNGFIVLENYYLTHKE